MTVTRAHQDRYLRRTIERLSTIIARDYYSDDDDGKILYLAEFIVVIIIVIITIAAVLPNALSSVERKPHSRAPNSPQLPQANVGRR